MAMKAPLSSCFQKFCVDTQSSHTNIRLCSSAATACTASPTLMPSCCVTLYIIRSSAANMQVVWNVSVHTSVLMPPRRVYSQMSSVMPTTVIGNGTPTASNTKRCRMMQTT